MKKFKELLIVLISIIPLAYLFMVWETLPLKIPIHFNLQGNPDNYGRKYALIVLISVLTIGTYLFMRYIPKIDPKRNFNIFKDTFYKLRLILALFFSVIGINIINSAQTGSTSSAFIFIIISILISIFGNYMSNIRPNYFIGIRTPWTLENETIWKQTHKLTGRLWFIAGIVMCICALLLPIEFMGPLFIGGILTITIIPIAYSYSHYRSRKTNEKTES